MKAALKNSLKDAMKAKDQGKMDLIRSLLSAIQYEEIQNGTDELDETNIVAVLKRELKKKQEEIEFASKAGRNEVVEQGKKDVKVIESFLPKQMSSEELESQIKNFLTSTPGANMGVVMKFLKEKFDGQYDGKTASEITKRVINQ